MAFAFRVPQNDPDLPPASLKQITGVTYIKQFFPALVKETSSLCVGEKKKKKKEK